MLWVRGGNVREGKCPRRNVRHSVSVRMELAILSLVLPSRSASPHFGRYSFPVPQRVVGLVGQPKIQATVASYPQRNGNEYQPNSSECSAVGKVTVGLALHGPCVTDSVVYSSTASMV